MSSLDFNNDNNNNNNGLLADPLGSSSLLKYINYNLKKKKKVSYLQIMQYTMKSRSRINRIEVTVKLTNPSVLCYIKKFLESLKKVM